MESGKHFKNLLNRSEPNNVPNNINTYEPMLDSKIHLQELRVGLMVLKPGKSPGPDGVLAEYLKFLDYS